MSEINDLVLELVEHDWSDHTATVRVTYKINFSLAELQIDDFRFKEKIQLWGVSNPDVDKFLYEFAGCSFQVGDSALMGRERNVTVRDDMEDNDAWWRSADEIYAKVWITPLLPESDFKSSNFIEMQF